MKVTSHSSAVLPRARASACAKKFDISSSWLDTVPHPSVGAPSSPTIESVSPAEQYVQAQTPSAAFSFLSLYEDMEYVTICQDRLGTNRWNKSGRRKKRTVEYVRRRADEPDEFTRSRPALVQQLIKAMLAVRSRLAEDELTRAVPAPVQSSRFIVQISAQNGATTQLESDTCSHTNANIGRSRYGSGVPSIATPLPFDSISSCWMWAGNLRAQNANLYFLSAAFPMCVPSLSWQNDRLYI